MLIGTKKFIEQNISLLDKNDLATFLELASISYYIVVISDLLNALEEAGIEGIKEAQYQALANQIGIEIRDAFKSPSTPSIVKLEEWIDWHNRFNLGFNNQQVLTYIIEHKDEYSNDVDIHQNDEGDWFMTEAW